MLAVPCLPWVCVGRQSCAHEQLPSLLPLQVTENRLPWVRKLIQEAHLWLFHLPSALTAKRGVGNLVEAVGSSAAEITGSWDLLSTYLISFFFFFLVACLETSDTRQVPRRQTEGI